MKNYKNINGYPLDLLARRVKHMSEKDIESTIYTLMYGGSRYNEYGQPLYNPDDYCPDDDIYETYVTADELAEHDREVALYQKEVDEWRNSRL